jgi:hypothetical protein
LSIIQLIVVLAVVGIILWAIGQLPIDAAVMKLIKVVVIVVLALWVLSLFGLLPDGPVPRLHHW